MGEVDRQEITQVLRRWSDGEEAALDELMPWVYEELNLLARHYLRREHHDNSLETGGLVHEAYLRLIDHDGIRWTDRRHFYGIAARTMRRILIEAARRRDSIKRGRDVRLVPFEEAIQIGEQSPSLCALDDALKALAKTDPDRCRLVELRFFAGLSHGEIAELLEVSIATIDRRWRLARAWLYDVLDNS